MLNRSRSALLPTFQRLQASMREFDQYPMGNNTRPVLGQASTGPIPLQACSSGANSGCANGNWREAGEELRRLRSQIVVLIERMLRNHDPHDVLTQVPENNNWRSKTFVLALKIERLMFLAAPSRENYLNEHTLRNRVQLLSRHLVRIRKRKNVMANMLATGA